MVFLPGEGILCFIKNKLFQILHFTTLKLCFRNGHVEYPCFHIIEAQMLFFLGYLKMESLSTVVVIVSLLVAFINKLTTGQLPSSNKLQIMENLPCKNLCFRIILDCILRF